jgi:hypothetical protein
MTEEIRFPYQLNNAFVVSLRASRIPKVPDSPQLEFTVQLKVIDEQLPERLQLNLIFSTVGEEPVAFSTEVVGLFDLVEGQAAPKRDITTEFINERALFLLWPFITQTLRMVTGQMGINPVTIRTPYMFGYEPPEKEEEE